MLQAIAARLLEAVGDASTVARIGGDEFAILLPRAREAEALRVADRVSGNLDDAILTDRGPFPVSASIGIALYPANATTYDGLLEYADRTMYVIKRSTGRPS